jgi:hypothetical protein
MVSDNGLFRGFCRFLVRVSAPYLPVAVSGKTLTGIDNISDVPFAVSDLQNLPYIQMAGKDCNGMACGRSGLGKYNGKSRHARDG